MVGWLDVEALAATLGTGEVHFHSRSRGRLWRKGESSGNVLRLRGLALDCDGDALLIAAEPAGPTCHRDTRSCFDPDAVSKAVGGCASRAASRRSATGPDPQGFGWLESLWATIADRAATRPEGSYTVTLLDGGVDLAGRKVAGGGDRGAPRRQERRGGRGAPAPTAPRRRELLAGEAGDLVYHALVLLAERGLEPRAVLDVLRHRHGTSRAGLTSRQPESGLSRARSARPTGCACRPGPRATRRRSASGSAAAGSVIRTPLTVIAPPWTRRRASPRDGARPVSASSTAAPAATISGVVVVPSRRREHRGQQRRVRDGLALEQRLRDRDGLAGRRLAVDARRHVDRQPPLRLARLRAARPTAASSASISSRSHVREPAQVRADVAVVHVDPVLVERVRRRARRVQPDGVAALALAELRARRRQEQLVGDPVRRALVGLAARRPPDQLEARGDVPPLVRAAHLHLDAVLAVQRREVEAPGGSCS